MPIYPTSVWQCDDAAQAERLLESSEAGYVYQRDGHPNSDALSEKLRALHRASHAVVTSSGMSALTAAILSQLQQGDHVLVSHRMYGRSLKLLSEECLRLGITSNLVDTCRLQAVSDACQSNTRLVVVESISNPMLRIADVRQLATLAHDRQALLLVDNTFATPALFRPLDFGADLVVESISKMLNGHSDVILGLLCGGDASVWERVEPVVSAWGLGGSPFDCWLAQRGLGTLPLRLARAVANAAAAARYLEQHAAVQEVCYPGLTRHPEHALARDQFGEQFGHVVSFRLAGGASRATCFVRQAERIPFCPSLGDICTTISHPASTSHRGMSDQQLQLVDVDQGTLRLSVGCESQSFVLEALEQALA